MITANKSALGMMKRKLLPTPFWITNVSNMNVSLADLALTIKAFSTVNLMDIKHYSYTPEQLKKSAESGSLFRKRNKLVVRKIAPPDPKKETAPINRNTVIPSRERSTLEIKEEKYEELQFTDEEFAQENAETADLDAKPLFSKKENT
jgi:hypothetical protein